MTLHEESYDGDSEPPIVQRRRSRDHVPGRARMGASSIKDITVGEIDDDDDLSILSSGDTVRSRNELVETGPATGAHTAIAIKMAAMQASFAEKTALEMKQIVDWYADNKEEDRFLTIKQSQSLPDNAIACVDEGDDDSLIIEATPKRANTMLSPRAESSRLLESGTYAHSASPQCVETEFSTHTASTSVDSLTSTLAASPMALRSPVSSSIGDFTSEELKEERNTYSSRKVAAEQNLQIQVLLSATKFMADIVLEYEQTSSSASDIDNSPRTRIATRKIVSPVRQPHAPVPLSNQNRTPQKCRNRRKCRLNKKTRRAIHFSALIFLLTAIAFGVRQWRRSSSAPAVISQVPSPSTETSPPAGQCHVGSGEQHGPHPDACEMISWRVETTHTITLLSKYGPNTERRRNDS